MNEEVILVDERNNEIGLMEKMEAHKKGLLHRAFSIFIFNDKKELLIHQRAASKYHSPNLWTNTCCSHPRVGETLIEAAERRLKEEMGMSAEMIEVHSFIYKAEMMNDLIEHEYDHVFVGVTNDQPIINPDEVKDWKHVPIQTIKDDIKNNPTNYTEWFKIILENSEHKLFIEE